MQVRRKDRTGISGHLQISIVVSRQIKICEVTLIHVIARVGQIELPNLHMIGFDFLEIVQDKFLIISCVILVRYQLADLVIHVYQTGLDQPLGRLEFLQHKVERVDQEIVTIDQQIIYKQLLIDGFQYFASLDSVVFVEVLSIKHFNVKTKLGQSIIIHRG